MEWTEDVAAGDWIRDRLDSQFGTIHGVVPRGFPAYGRVFHPASRSRPVGEPWPPQPEEDHRREWAAFAARAPEIETEPARWADAADSFGTVMHPLAQWGALTRARGDDDDPNGWQQVTAPDGWQYDAPTEGGLDADVLAAVARHLARATATPDAGYAGVWEGWGGLLGFLGETPSRAFFSFASDDDGEDTHSRMLAASHHDPFNKVFTKPTWQPGILSDEISRGPRLELTDRAHVLFRGAVAEFVDEDWVLRMPWRDRVAEAHGFAPSAASPSLIWPDDHAWVLVTEVDFDSTIVAGSRALIDAICADPSLEAHPIPEDAVLTWDADGVNR